MEREAFALSFLGVILFASGWIVSHAVSPLIVTRPEVTEPSSGAAEFKLWTDGPTNMTIVVEGSPGIGGRVAPAVNSGKASATITEPPLMSSSE